eukprot:CAMPEP_0119015636 /NCGR_PEP_ID=MMETSP1176-20130426/11340_1 /TAXON_ID=265551 /ORGANISM="Synedropsis recta cf, Strain CCMP1620" /LENGTH=232 /DNA_ID=CAMNT_0006968945 /DNA_START=34 /DNA_END=732 /DNA_ORIENTATION=+
MKISLTLLLSAICAVRLAVGQQAWTIEDEKIVEELDSKSLTDTAAGCGFEDVVLFNTKIELIPPTGMECSVEDQINIGRKINAALYAVGIGDEKVVDAEYTMLGAVCPETKLADMTTTRSLRRRLIGGYIWNGGGGCHGCSADNGDGRMLNIASSPRGQTSSFKENFKDKLGPDIVRQLKKLLKDEDAMYLSGSDEAECLGSDFDVEVAVDVVYFWQLDFECAAAALLPNAY